MSRQVARYGTLNVYCDFYSDGSYLTGGLDTYTRLTPRALADGGLTISRGRDQARPLGKPMTATAGVVLDNRDRILSPENAGGPLYQVLDPGKSVKVVDGYGSACAYNAHVGYNDPILYNGRAVASLFVGLLDDLEHTTTVGQRQASLKAVGNLYKLNGVTVSTPLSAGITSGSAVNLVLDAAGWPAGADYRTVASGDTTLAYWWLDEADAMAALNDLLTIEGPPAAIYEDGAGRFVFENRLYRATTTRANTTRGTFSDTGFGGTSYYHVGLAYSPNNRDIINDCSVAIKRRQPQPTGTVWTYGGTFTLAAGATTTIFASVNDPVTAVQTPVALYSAGTATITLPASLQYAQKIGIQIVAGGAGCTGTALSFLAQTVATVSEQVVPNDVTAASAASISKYKRKSLPISARQELSEAYALALANAVVTYYQQPRPTVTLSLANVDGDMLSQMLEREISDRITIVDAQLGLGSGTADFWIEQISHKVTEFQGRIHETTWACTAAAGATGGALWDLGEWDLDVWNA